MTAGDAHRPDLIPVRRAVGEATREALQILINSWRRQSGARRCGEMERAIH
jgi:hypothetical protein